MTRGSPSSEPSAANAQKKPLSRFPSESEPDPRPRRPPYGVFAKGGRAVSASRSGFAPLRSDSSSGSEPGRTFLALAGLVPEIWKTPMQSSSSAITYAKSPRRTTPDAAPMCGRPPLGRGLGQVELAERAELERRQVLWSVRALPSQEAATRFLRCAPA